MAKKDRKKESGPKPNSFSAFLKKRAPIYLGIMGLFLIFAVPQLTSNSLQGLFPEELTVQEREVLDSVMSYSGPNERGLTVLEALDMKIKERFSDDKILDDKSAGVLISVSEIDSDTAGLAFTFESSKGEVEYTWSLDYATGEITGTNPEAESVVELVDFYD